MPSSKGKGNDKGSPQKKEKGRNYLHRAGKSNKSDSLAESSTPVRAKPSPAETPPPYSPGRDSGINAPIVTTTKKKTPTIQENESEDDSSKEGSSTSVTMSTWVKTNGADPHLDLKLDRVLQEFILAKKQTTKSGKCSKKRD